MPLINSILNGATEAPGTSNDSLRVYLAGPIRAFWRDDMWDSPLHRYYTAQRENTHTVLSEEFLVFAPHLAFRGPWNESFGSMINNMAVLGCDAFVYFVIPDLEAEGTERERRLATAAGTPAHPMLLDQSGREADRLAAIMTALTTQNEQRLKDNRYASR